MHSRKCPGCGLVSFATTDDCKRCKTSLKVADERVESKTSPTAYGIYDDEPRRSFSPLRILLLILLVGLPLWYYCQSSQTGAVEDRAADEKKQQQLRQEHGNLICPRGKWTCP